jgi:hypothetical protein
MGVDQANSPRDSRGGTATASRSGRGSAARSRGTPLRARLEDFHPRPGPRGDRADGRRMDVQSLQLEYKSRGLATPDLPCSRAIRLGSRS